jgi:hypothetical protein
VRVVRKKMIPAEEVEEVTYQCDVPDCDFEAYDEDDLKTHFGRKHTVRASATILDDLEVYWFEFEDQAKAWLGTAEYLDVGSVYWDGPGWYFVANNERPCHRGCCTSQDSDLESVASLVSDKRSAAGRMLREADDIEKAVKALEKPCSDNG